MAEVYLSYMNKPKSQASAASLGQSRATKVSLKEKLAKTIKKDLFNIDKAAERVTLHSLQPVACYTYQDAAGFGAGDGSCSNPQE